MTYKDKNICVYDYGLFVELAVTLAKDFGRTYYYCPWQDGYPKSNGLLIGDGLPDVTRLHSIWPVLDDIDLFVFPDVFEGTLQKHLLSLGKRVWGARLGEELELDRIASKEHCRKLGIDIGPYVVLSGLDNLRAYLKEHDHQWVKISATRGDMETFQAKNYRLIEPRLDELEHTLGAKKKIIRFIVEAEIEPAVEVGYDGYTVDGCFAETCLYGIEVKDKGYVGRVKAYQDLPEGVRGVNDKLADTFAAYGYRGFWSSEIRLTPDGRAYLIDPCARSGSPPNELYQLMVTNLAEIIWEGSGGVVVEPQFRGSWGAMLLLTSEWAMHNWQAVEFPEEYVSNVKLRNLTIIDGKRYYVPDRSSCSAVGAVVAAGNSRQEAIDVVKEIAESVEGHYIETASHALDDAIQEIQDLQDFGVDF